MEGECFGCVVAVADCDFLLCYRYVTACRRLIFVRLSSVAVDELVGRINLQAHVVNAINGDGVVVVGVTIGVVVVHIGAEVAEVYEKYFREVEPIATPSTTRPRSPATVSSSVVSSGYTYDRWLAEVKRLSDAEILERIFASGSTGELVRALYDGDTSRYGGDHSRADQALCTYLYGFTSDLALTERLFRSSRLYRATGKSRTYLERTLTRAASECKQLVGHIVFTDAEKKAYAQKKEAEERAAGRPSYGSFIRDRARKRGNRP